MNWSVRGSLVLTRKRFVAFTLCPYFNSVIDVRLDDERLKQMDCSLKDEAIVYVTFDPSPFRVGWSGSVACRFSTTHARSFLKRLKEATA